LQISCTRHKSIFNLTSYKVV